MSSQLFPAVFFGCWNQPGYGNNSSPPPRNIVAESVHAMKDIQVILLGGDNVYPRPLRTGKKNKLHEADVFMEGIQLYTSTAKQIIPAFGNHNESLLDVQKDFFKLEKTYNTYEFVNNVHVIVLDTNIFLHDPDNSVYIDMLEWFRTTVTDLPPDHHYFVVQHEPYFTARKKGLGELVNADPFLDILFIRPPIAILCADTHHYQHATIQRVSDPDIKIHQFIVGTGGANPDLHMDGFESAIMRDKYVFTQHEVVAGYGYLRIPDIDPLHFEFIRVLPWSPTHGGSRRRRGRQHQRKTRRKSC
jgi:hypothetical protein